MRLIPLTLLMVLVVSAAAAKGVEHAPLACMSASEAREAVAEHKLIAPMRAVRSAEKTTRAEPLHSRLCTSHEVFIYELTLLRRDGKVIRLFMNAASGVYLKHRAQPEREKPRPGREKLKPHREKPNQKREKPQIEREKPQPDRDKPQPERENSKDDRAKPKEDR